MSKDSDFQEPPYSSCKLWAYGISISLGTFQFGYSVGVYNPTSLVLMQIYDNAGKGWSIAHKQPYNTLVSTIPQVGAFLGSLLAFVFVQRRLVHGFFIFNFFSITGAVLSLFLEIPLLLIGRFISGFAAGNFSYLVPIMLSEISPRRVRGAVSNLTQNFISVGVFVPSLIGLSLPHYTFQVHASDPIWRLILGFPAAVAVIHILLFLIFFRLDPPSTYFKLNDTQGALRALKLVYTNQGAEQRLNQVIAARGGSQVSSGSSIHKEAPNPPRALTVCIFLSIFNQLTGISSVLFYSSQIFSSKSNPSNIYSGIVVSALVGSVSLGATFISLFFVDRIGRRALLLIGSVVMCVATALTGLFEQLNQQTLSEVAVLVFLTGFFFSSGPLLWIYLPETLNSKGVTIGAAMNWLSVIVISLITPQLQKLDQWMFYIYAILNAAGFVFVWFWLVESKGKTKTEIQNGYKSKGSEYEILSPTP